MLSNFAIKHFTTASFINFIPKNIDLVSLNKVIPNQIINNEPLNCRNRNENFKRHFAKWFSKSKIEALREKSNLGDYDAQFELGSYYLSSNNDEGIRYIKNAADHNNIFACYTYGKFLKDGLRVKKNLSESLKYLTYAADHDLEIAQSKLAHEYYTGENFPQDMTKALHYFCKSADNGNVSSCETAGTLLLQGIGCKYDKELAKKYFQLGSSLNCALCKYYLSIIYRIDSIKESIRLLKEAADIGLCIAQREYGNYLLFNEENENEAEKYFRLASSQNDSESCFKLSELLKQSEDDEKRKEASLFLNKAADMGHEIAMLQVGKVCESPSSEFDYPLITNLDIEDNEPIKEDQEDNDHEVFINDEKDLGLIFPKQSIILNLFENGLLQY